MSGVELWADGVVAMASGRVSIRATSALLDALADERSVQRAADRLGVSYRSAWGRLTTLERAFGRALVTKTKGHGSVLTPAGHALRAALRSVLDGMAVAMAAEALVLQRRIEAIVEPPRARCRIAISHDPVLVDRLASMVDVDLAVVGSAEAVERLLSRRADAAGFHLGPEPGQGASDAAALMADPSYEVAPLFRRDQGLMVAAGNPRRIGSVADLARPELRFVNRQRGSGTRAWTDHLLARGGVPAAAVRGYSTEEFTHAAVAATVASGMADAGMGVRSAAERFGLDFIPLGEETYFLAARTEGVHPAIAGIVTAMQEGGRGLAPADLP